MDKVIIVEFAGWIKCNPEDVWFTLIEPVFGENNYSLYPRISGNEYILLNDELKEKYILESLTECMKIANDDEFTDMTVLVEDE